MSYGDFVIRRQERLVDDEFERSMLHKSATVPLPRYSVPSRGEFLGMITAFVIICVGFFHSVGWPRDPFFPS